MENRLQISFLKGLSTGDLQEALVWLVGDRVLKESWAREYAEWKIRRNTDRLAYVYADGILIYATRKIMV